MKYTDQQIKTALSLVKKGATHKQAAKKAKMKVYSINYYLTRGGGGERRPTTHSSYKTVIRETISRLEALL